MDLKLYCSWLLTFAVLVLLLWQVNLSRRQRYRQYWLPAAAVGYAAAAVAWYHDLWEPLVRLLAAFLQSWGVNWPPLTGDFPVVFNFLFLALFWLGKSLAVGSQALLSWLRQAWAARSGPATPPVDRSGSAPLPRWSWAYEWHLERGVLLRQEWIYPGVVLQFLAGGLFLLLAVCLVQIVRPLPLPLPQFPALSLLLVLELAWYLGGSRPGELPAQITGTEVRSDRLADYEALWQEYQEVWPDRLLGAGHLATGRPEPPPAPRLAPAAASGLDEEIAAVCRGLQEQGFPLTAMHQSIIEQLWRGQDLILSEAWADELAPLFLAYLNHIWLQGGRVAVLTENEVQRQAVLTWLNRTLAGAPFFAKVRTAASYQDGLTAAAPADILVATVADLHTPTIDQDFGRAQVHALLIVSAHRTLGPHLGTVQAFLARLNEVLSRRLQYVICSPDRYGLESALRRNICLDPDSRERKLSPAPAPQVLAILWQAEGEAWQKALLAAEISTYLGAEPVLATLAWREEVQDIFLLQHEALPLLEYLQEVDNHLAILRAGARLRGKLIGSAFQALQRPAASWLCPPLRQGVLAIRDAEHNLATALGRWQTRATELALLLIVSPPYLLRDYLAANIAYFLTAAPLALAPRIMKSRFAVAFTLLQRLLAVEVRDGDILTELREIYPQAKNVPDQLAQLFSEIFVIDLKRLSLLQRRRHHRFDAAAARFDEEITWRLDPRILDQPGLAFLDRYTMMDSNHNQLGVCSADHLQQTYLPGQIHTINGRPYIVVRSDAATKLFHVEHCPHLKGEGTYRPDIRIALEKEHTLFYGGHTRERQRGPWRVRLDLREGDFTLQRLGYFFFPRGIDLRPTQFHYETVSPAVAPPRRYRYGRLLTIEFCRRDGQEFPNAARVAFTLATLLNEAFLTLFPETHRFLHATTSLPDDFFSNQDLARLFPTLAAEGGAEAGQPLTPAIRLVVVEDSQVDLGLVQCLFDDWQYVFLLLLDYLSWLLEEKAPPTAAGWRLPGWDKQRFLKYGFEDFPAEFDLAGALQLLRELEPLEATTPCCRHRRDFYAPGQARPGLKSPAGSHRCDFCGRPLSATELERLQDGRERCSACKANAIDTVAELTRVFQEGRDFLARTLGLSLRRGLTVAFTDAHTLHQAAGASFLPTHELDPRTIGLAVKEGDACKIIIENGQPYHLTLATIVHELTHIWQFDHLNIDRLKQEYGGLLVEGLAAWAELTCLARKNLAPEFRQQYLERDDDYGRGYRLVLELLQQPGAGENPFTLLQRLYPAPLPT
jgi:hypothetical protein